MVRQRQLRHVGDIQVALAVTLTRPDGTVVDLSSMAAVYFKMLDSEGATKVAQTATGISITDAANGEVQYTFAAAGVDEEGSFYGYFVTEDTSGNEDTFPVERGDLELAFKADT